MSSHQIQDKAKKYRESTAIDIPESLLLQSTSFKKAKSSASEMETQKTAITLSTFPSDDVPVEVKSKKQWNMAWVTASINQFFSGRTVVAWQDRSRMVLLRQYCDGNQPVSMYYPRLFGNSVANDSVALQKRLGLYRSSFQIESPMPALFEYILGKWYEADFFIETKSTSPFALEKKRQKRFKSVALGALGASTLAAMAEAGVQVRPETVSFTPMDAELIDQMGGFKDAEELAAEVTLNNIKETSDNFLYEYLFCQDAVCFKKMITKAFFDPVDGKVKRSYVDPVNFIGRMGDSADPDSLIFGGEVKIMSIKEIRRRAAAAGQTISESVLAGAARTYFNYFQNNRFASNSNAFEYMSMGNTAFTYDFFNVLVYEAVYRSTDYEEKVLKKDENGNFQYGRATEEDKASGQFEVNKIAKERFYRASLILGTNIIFDWGPNYNQCYDEKGRPDTPYKVCVLPGKSMVEKVIPVLDDIAVDFIQFQNKEARAIDDIVVVRKEQLMDATSGGTGTNDMNATELLGISGIVVAKSLQALGTSMMNLPEPVSIVSGTSDRLINRYAAKMNINAQRLIALSGISRATPAPRVSGELIERNEAVNEHGLTYLIEMKKDLMQRFAESAYNMVRLACKYSPEARERYKMILGESLTQVIVENADIPIQDMGIFLKPKLSSVQVQMELQNLQALMKGGKDGNNQMPASLYFMIRRALFEGKIREAEAYIRYYEEKDKTMQAERSKASMQIQAQLNQQNQQMAQQFEAFKIWEEARAEAWLETQKIIAELKFGKVA